MANRARFPVEVVRRIRREVGDDFPILYRMSAEERIPGGTTLEDTLQLVAMLEQAGVDCFDVSAGIYDSIEAIYSLYGQAPGALLPLATAVKRESDRPVIGISRLGWDLELRGTGGDRRTRRPGLDGAFVVGRSLPPEEVLRRSPGRDHSLYRLQRMHRHDGARLAASLRGEPAAFQRVPGAGQGPPHEAAMSSS